MKECLIYTTDVFRFDINKSKWVEKRDYEILQSFKFSGLEFCLTYKDGYYFICYQNEKGCLYSLLYKKKETDGFKLTPGEVVSDFRKQYLKNAINLDKIEKFIQDPVKFGKK